MSLESELRSFLSKCIDFQDQDKILKILTENKVTLKVLTSLASKSLDRVDGVLKNLNIAFGYCESIKLALEELSNKQQENQNDANSRIKSNISENQQQEMSTIKKELIIRKREVASKSSFDAFEKRRKLDASKTESKTSKSEEDDNNNASPSHKKKVVPEVTSKPFLSEIITEFNAPVLAEKYATNGNLEALKNVLSKSKVTIHTRLGKEKITILHLACQFGHLPIVKWISETVPNTNWEVKGDEYGGTPLHYAAFQGHLEVLRFLLNEEKVDVNLKDKMGWTIMHDAAFGAQHAVLRFIAFKKGNLFAKASEAKNRQAVIHAAAESEASDEKKLQVLKYLVEQFQVQVDEVDSNGTTPLVYCIRMGNIKCIEYLISKGASLSIKYVVGMFDSHERCQNEDIGKEKATLGILQEACNTKSLELVKLLIEKVERMQNNLINKQYSVNVNSSGGKYSCLNIAIKNKDVPMMRYLKSKGVSLDSKEVENHPLIRALKKGLLHILKILVEEFKCDIFFADLETLLKYCKTDEIKHYIKEFYVKKNTGESIKNPKSLLLLESQAIVHCAERGDIVKLKAVLVGGKVDPQVFVNGVTALHLASAKGRITIVKYLIEELHCDPNIRSSEARQSMTPLHLAAFHGKLEIVKYLMSHGADANLKGGKRQQSNALDYALEAIDRNEQLIEFLSSKGLQPKDMETENTQTTNIQVKKEELNITPATSTSSLDLEFVSDEETKTITNNNVQEDDDLEFL